MPSCLYTDPQVAHVGLTEAETRRRSIPVHIAKIPAASILRTQTISETKRFLKALISPDDGLILGFTMIGAEAGEVMTAVQLAMQAGLPYTALRDSVIAHPTMTEGLNVPFSAVELPSAKPEAVKTAWPQTSLHRVQADGVTIF